MEHLFYKITLAIGCVTLPMTLGYPLHGKTWQLALLTFTKKMLPLFSVAIHSILFWQSSNSRPFYEEVVWYNNDDSIDSIEFPVVNFSTKQIEKYFPGSGNISLVISSMFSLPK